MAGVPRVLGVGGGAARPWRGTRLLGVAEFGVTRLLGVQTRSGCRQPLHWRGLPHPPSLGRSCNFFCILCHCSFRKLHADPGLSAACPVAHRPLPPASGWDPCGSVQGLAGHRHRWAPGSGEALSAPGPPALTAATPSTSPSRTGPATSTRPRSSAPCRATRRWPMPRVPRPLP